MGINVAEIKNNALKEIAEKVDSENTKDGVIDSKEIEIFKQQVEEKFDDMNNNLYTSLFSRNEYATSAASAVYGGIVAGGLSYIGSKFATKGNPLLKALAKFPKSGVIGTMLAVGLATLAVTKNENNKYDNMKAEYEKIMQSYNSTSQQLAAEG